MSGIVPIRILTKKNSNGPSYLFYLLRSVAMAYFTYLCRSSARLLFHVS